MRLSDVYETSGAVDTLYALLAERPKKAWISHREMPSFEDHEAFIESRPYAHWYLIVVEDTQVGAVYLTHHNEIGIGIFRSSGGLGYAKAAIKELMKLHPRDGFRANINPENLTSIYVFGQLGFAHISNTYEKRHA